ncbi:hypothetical protein [Gorillibacterium sp. sgz5001074]|uniref:hypothetical protein n=1 Tax=Gorillibacterium sp. sgz5001074 TaxID=3446695 RepID=UPI003F6792B6
MTKRGVGAVFCVASIALYVLPSVIAAIAASGGPFENYTLIKNMISFNKAVYLSLFAGVGYLAWAEFDHHKKSDG